VITQKSELIAKPRRIVTNRRGVFLTGSIVAAREKQFKTAADAGSLMERHAFGASKGVVT